MLPMPRYIADTPCLPPRFAAIADAADADMITLRHYATPLRRHAIIFDAAAATMMPPLMLLRRRFLRHCRLRRCRFLSLRC